MSAPLTVITGAGTGIGEAVAKRLARGGGRVAVVDRDASGASRVAEEIVASGGLAEAVVLDVSDSDAVTETLGRLGSVAGLVNNAAVLGGVQPLEETSDALYEEIMGSTFKSSFLCSRAVIPGMLERGGGSIVNVGSIDSHIGVAGQSVYCAAKGAMLLFTRSLAVEYSSRGIRTNLVCPGAVATPMYNQAVAAAADPEAMVAGLVSNMPIGRIGEPDEIASVVEFLLSDASSFVSGASYAVDGGWSAT